MKINHLPMHSRSLARRFAVPLLAAGCLAWASAASAGDTDLDVKDYRGKVVVLDFWASWCVPCLRSFPWMNAMQSKYGEDGLVFIAVNVDRDGDDAAAFLRKNPANFEIRYDPDGKLAEQFEVLAMPSSYVFGRDGQAIARHLGFKVRKQDEYEATLVGALAVSQSGAVTSTTNQLAGTQQ